MTPSEDRVPPARAPRPAGAFPVLGTGDDYATASDGTTEEAAPEPDAPPPWLSWLSSGRINANARIPWNILAPAADTRAEEGSEGHTDVGASPSLEAPTQPQHPPPSLPTGTRPGTGFRVLTWESQASDTTDDEDTNVWDSPPKSQARWAPAGGQTTALAPIGTRPSHLDDQPGWYARLKLRERHLAKLWAYNLTERDVMVWSPDHSDWVPLLALRQMRAAVLSVLQDCETTQPATEKPAPADRQSAPPGAPATSLGQAAELGQASRYASSSSIPPTMAPVSGPDIAGAPHLTYLRFLSALARIHPTFGPRCAQAVSRAIGFVYASPLARRVLEQGPLAHRDPLRRAERVFWGCVVLVVAILALRTNARAPRNSNPAASAPVSSLASRPALCAPSMVPTRSWLSVPDRVFTLNDLPTYVADATTRAMGAQKAGPANASERLRSAAAPDAVAPRATQGTRAGAAALAKGSAPRSKPGSAPGRQAEFDPDAARRALGGAVQKARICAAAGGAKGSMLVTFNQSGAVQSASLAGVGGTGVRRDCLVRVFAQARVPPFAGPPVTVRKSFDLQYSVQ